MAYSPWLAKSHYENMSPEEIVKKYNSIIAESKIPTTKEELIERTIYYVLHPSEKTNSNSSITALKELYFEKTGKELENPNKNAYSERFYLEDVIKYVSKIDPFWTVAITDFFKKVDKSDDEKMFFLIHLYVDKESFNEFTKEILKTDDALATYKKYEEKSRQYISRNALIG